MRLLFSLVITLMLAAGGIAAYALIYYQSPGPLSQPVNIVFKRGVGFMGIADDLGAQGVITQPLLFKALAAGLGEARKFKAGEYAFTPGMTPAEVMQMIADGKVVVHKVTVAEGLSVREALKLIADEKALEGEMPSNVPEGSLLPETYHFTLGDTRKSLIERMQSDMQQFLQAQWKKRKDGLPISTPEQALVLASIVEKETGVDGERGRVASVFVNRLKKGMRLQSDPTAVYGIEQQTGKPMGRLLTYNDLAAVNAYNTYVIDGLPPTPIANPGRAAISAVLNPPDTNDLYFVATGTGGHNFAPTLEQHNRNVAAYRQAMRGK